MLNLNCCLGNQTTSKGYPNTKPVLMRKNKFTSKTLSPLKMSKLLVKKKYCQNYPKLNFVFVSPILFFISFLLKHFRVSLLFRFTFNFYVPRKLTSSPKLPFFLKKEKKRGEIKCRRSKFIVSTFFFLITIFFFSV